MNDPAVTLTPCNSSMFDGYLYDEAHWTLTLRFKPSGLVKCYQNVEPEVYESFLSAESKGRFFNEHMKHKYDVLVVEEGDKPPLKVDGKDVAADADLSQFEKQPEIPTAAIEQEHAVIRKAEEISGAENSPSKSGAVYAESDEVLSECYIHMKAVPHWKRPDGTMCCSLCHPKPGTGAQSSQDAATATNGKPDALQTVPAVLAPLEPPKTPAEAIRLLTEQDGLIQATIAKSRELAQDAMAVRVTDPKSYADAGERLKFLVSCQDRAVNFLDPIRSCLLTPYQKAQGFLKAAKEPFETAMAHVKRQRVMWADEQERIRLAEQERLRREQEAAAEAERKARGEQMTLGAVDEALASGDTSTAEKLISEPIQAAPVYLPPVHVESAVPEEKGISKRKNWKAEVTNLEDLVLDIASGICSLRDGKGLGGHAPITFVEVNQTALNQAAKSQQKAMSYPGVKAFNDTVESVRRKK